MHAALLALALAATPPGPPGTPAAVAWRFVDDALDGKPDAELLRAVSAPVRSRIEAEPKAREAFALALKMLRDGRALAGSVGKAKVLGDEAVVEVERRYVDRLDELHLGKKAPRLTERFEVELVREDGTWRVRSVHGLGLAGELAPEAPRPAPEISRFVPEAGTLAIAGRLLEADGRPVAAGTVLASVATCEGTGELVAIGMGVSRRKVRGKEVTPRVEGGRICGDVPLRAKVAKTEADGRFLFTGLTEGSWALRAGTWDAEALVPAGKSGVELRRRGAGRAVVKGRLVDAVGRPVQGLVLAYAPSRLAPVPILLPAGDDGVFERTLSGAAEVVVFHYGTAHGAPIVVARTGAEVTLRLPPGAPLDGRVVRSDGVAPAKVAIWAPEGGVSPTEVATPGGALHLDDVPSQLEHLFFGA